MEEWEYQITFHELPQRSPEEGEKIIKCDQAGQCLVHDAFGTDIQWLEDLFREQGQKGWELVQAGHHHRELLCIWKRTKDAGKKG